jgi:benzodiazapine receptor
MQFLGVLTFCYLVSFAASEGAIRGLEDWYPGVSKPNWALASGAYVPLWTVLYGLMAVGAWMILRQPESEARRRANAIWLFMVQILLSGFWAWIFFALHQFLVSSLVIAIQWIVLGFTVWAFAKVRASAAWLMVPYWMWVSFATCFCFVVYRLNK